RDKTAIQGADENLALPDGDATIDDVTAAIDGPLRRHFWIVGPKLLPRCRLHREDFAPSSSEVHNPLNDYRRPLLAPARVQVHVPGHGELANRLIVDWHK